MVRGTRRVGCSRTRRTESWRSARAWGDASESTCAYCRRMAAMVESSISWCLLRMPTRNSASESRKLESSPTSDDEYSPATSSSMSARTTSERVLSASRISPAP